VTVDSADEKAFHRNLDSLRNAVSDQQIKYLVVFESDPAVSDTNVFVVTNSDNYYTLGRFEARISRIVSERRLARSDVNLPVDSVLALTRGLDLRTQDTKGERVSSEVKLFGSIIFVMLIYLMILTYGATLMRSVIEEKNSRIIEVIVSSVSPFQLMLGKIAGMALAALTTVTIWIAMGLALVMYSGSISLEIDPAIMNVIFNPLVVSGFALFLVFGFVLYSAFFAFIGSIVNTDKESQNFMWPVVLMLMVPVLTGSTVIRDPFTPWAVALSYLPPFAPTMMVMRIMFIAPTATGYSLFSGILGEMVLSLIILIVFTVFFIWVVGRIFRVGIFMYGKRPTLSEIVKWVRY
jgi:ABC-2 type transport system permease protein